MLNKNNCLRTCVYSNQTYPKTELVRLAKVNGKLIVDTKQNMLGRGYWIKLTPQAISDTKFLTIISKRCKTTPSSDLLDQLKQLLK